MSLISLAILKMSGYLRAGRPNRRRRQNTRTIGQSERRDRVTKICIGAITGIKQNDTFRNAGGFCRTNLVERDL
jgi:hypothetical protein